MAGRSRERIDRIVKSRLSWASLEVALTSQIVLQGSDKAPFIVVKDNKSCLYRIDYVQNKTYKMRGIHFSELDKSLLKQIINSMPSPIEQVNTGDSKTTLIRKVFRNLESGRLSLHEAIKVGFFSGNRELVF